MWSAEALAPATPPPLLQIDKPDQIQKMDITRDSRAAGNQRRGQFSASRFTADRSVRASAPQQRLTTEPQCCSSQQHVSSGKCDGGHFFVTVLKLQHISVWCYQKPTWIITESVKGLINGGGLKMLDLCSSCDDSAVTGTLLWLFKKCISSCYSAWLSRAAVQLALICRVW